MLLELRIENLAVIETLTLKLEPGLNTLTGETGAGKSIIVGALGLLMGERASSDAVRSGASRAVVEGVFDVSALPDVRALLEDRGITVDEELLVVRREIVPEGRSRVWVSGAAATVGLIAEVGRRLVDLHGQHEHQTLLRGDEQRVILDAFAGGASHAAEVSGAWDRLTATRQSLASFDARRREIMQRADVLRLQVQEIDQARLRAGEEDDLEREETRLEHAGELSQLARRLHGELYADEDAIAGRLDNLHRTLEALARLDPACTEWDRVLEEARYGLEEFGRQMGAYAEAIRDDPARLEEIRRRQDLLYRLKARYGPELPDVIEAGRRARSELDHLDSASLERTALEKEHAEAREQHASLCVELTGLRRAAAERLDQRVNEALRGLGN
ncbi:MAG: AAA family ATPase [Gemmatimonadetes bacterium]|nr:AAA family ATPase [Gemmatimonadota bacterium]